MMSGRFVPAMTLITARRDAAPARQLHELQLSIQQFASGTASFGASLLIGRNAAAS